MKGDIFLRIYPEENSIINFELIYQINNGEFELKPGQPLNFNIMANNNFVFNIIDLIENGYYKNSNTKIDHYTLNDNQYDNLNLILINGSLAENKLQLPIIITDKNILGDISISLESVDIIENDVYKCVNTSSFYKIKFNPQKPNIYLLSNNSENIHLNSKTLKELDSLYDFYQITEDAILRIYPLKNDIISFELKYQIHKDFFELKPGEILSFNIMSLNHMQFKLINLDESEKYFIEIKNGSIVFDYYEIDGSRHNRFENLISVFPKKETVNFEIYFTLKYRHTTELLSIHLYKYNKDNINDEGGENTDYSAAVSFASICAYACFAIFALSFLIILYSFCGINFIEDGNGGNEIGKTLKALYLCKRD